MVSDSIRERPGGGDNYFEALCSCKGTGIRRYRHGTATGYKVGECRCDKCTAAQAVYQAGYRARYRFKGKRGEVPGERERL